jgi:hypothetical protein
LYTALKFFREHRKFEAEAKKRGGSSHSFMVGL